MRRAWIIGCLCIGSCLLNAGSKERMRDAVVELNDHARWGRTPAAVGRVADPYRKEFVARHSNWGRDVQIADVEVEHMELHDDEDYATAVVSWSWYELQHMDLQQTVVKQQWRKGNDGFELVSERIVSGNNRLFAAAAKTPAH